jgi:hypothetical protein
LTGAGALPTIAALQHSSLPGLTRQSILFVKTFLFLMDARVKPGMTIASNVARLC